MPEVKPPSKRYPHRHFACEKCGHAFTLPMLAKETKMPWCMHQGDYTWCDPYSDETDWTQMVLATVHVPGDEMKLWTATGGHGLWVVRARDEAQATEVALGGGWEAGSPGALGLRDYRPDAEADELGIVELSTDGPAAIVGDHFG